MSEFDEAVLESIRNPEKLNDFILKSEHFILKCASAAARKYISKNDDEWSIALSAFYDAIKTYNADSGSFYSYSKMLISRRLIDYFRSTNKFKGEMIKEDMSLYVVETENSERENLKYEIEEVNNTFKLYGFTFIDLTKCSPKADKTQQACKMVIRYLLNNPQVIKEMQLSRLFPIKKIQENLKVSRKILERHRRYIISVVEIIYGDYPYLKEYVQNIVKKD